MSPEVKELADYGRQPPEPYRASWVDVEGALEVQQWLRILPGKRYVGRAVWQGQEVLVKLFVGARAGRKATAEVEGYKRLESAGLPTPEMLHHGILPDGMGAWVVSQFIAQAQTLEQASGLGSDFKKTNNRHELTQARQIDQVVTCIAGMHQKGVRQQDIHPENFLLKDDQCWIIDTADVIPINEDQEAIANFAVFLAQLSEELWRGAWQLYRQLNSVAAEYDKVAALARQWQAWRARDLAEKSVRDCSLFDVESGPTFFRAVWRSESETLRPLLEDLDGALVAATLLKDGRSATVGLVEWQGRQLVIKRYNLKGLGHRLQRCWRPTRAWHSWQAGHRLRVLGINTPRPIAMVEERVGPLRGRGYLITEVAAGQDLMHSAQKADSQQLQSMAVAVRKMMTVMTSHRITHGDFKATNLLWDDALAMIDLDAVRWHKTHNGWRKAFKKDEARLLRNWSEASREYECFKNVINEDVTNKIAPC
ncbi:lipopolysaccharide kinase InaA family protein [Pseudomaricurvus sp.]|uniref:lipopolysaccharide kinase InaA family protein n=1 Tax=Pseudomaricurvus sp. TaxID=2004510 RepID=UPI003F6AD357